MEGGIRKILTFVKPKIASKIFGKIIPRPQVISNNNNNTFFFQKKKIEKKITLDMEPSTLDKKIDLFSFNSQRVIIDMAHALSRVISCSNCNYY